MHFNSYLFIFVFLPIALVGYYWFGKVRLYQAAMAWLVIVSLFFYAWWNPIYVILLIGSAFFNYYIGLLLKVEQVTKPNSLNKGVKQRKIILFAGICGNLILLAYFKYANFFVDTINQVFLKSFNLENIILPLGISFFTFTQIAYIVDAYRNEVKEYNLVNYLLFVSFFPHLIAGPILHHKEMMPQFSDKTAYVLKRVNLMVGANIFILGLFKKVILADNTAYFANTVFNAVASGTVPTFFEAWIGAVAYTLQLYFDFSGYSDMAIGLALMFNIKFPVNFNSPYKSKSIIEFWRRWHITLSRFLKDYLYIPLGGNRFGTARHYSNLMITMVLGGLWHGAGWTFIAWGTLHGVYLLLNHGWRSFRIKMGIINNYSNRFTGRIALSLTFISVVIAWVFFRSNNLATAGIMMQGLFGINGITSTMTLFSDFPGSEFSVFIIAAWLIALLAIVFFLPSIMQLMEDYRPAIDVSRKVVDSPSSKIKWGPNMSWSLSMGVILAFDILGVQQVSDFLYFQF